MYSLGNQTMLNGNERALNEKRQEMQTEEP